MSVQHRLRLQICPDPDQGESVYAGAELTLRVGERDGHTVLSVAGEIDITNSGWLTERLATEIDTAVAENGIIVDLASVGFCDASGIRSLLAVRNHCRERHASLLVTGVQGPVRRVLAITRADQALPLAPAPDREQPVRVALRAIDGDLAARPQPPVLATPPARTGTRSLRQVR
jgi:stage II sporulation protein AA (anti-sigma F factor antagonist)